MGGNIPTGPIISTSSKKARSTKAAASSRKTSKKRAHSPDVDKGEKGDKRSKPSGSEDTTTVAPVKSSANATTLAPKQVTSPTFIGNLDLYAMYLPFLKAEYLPATSTSPEYEKVYKTILTYQAKNDKTGRVYLASPTSPDLDNTSCFSSRLMLDPMEEMPFDITINSVQHKSLSFTKSERSAFAAPDAIPDGPGISGEMELAESHCGIQSASGVFKMKRVWTKPNPDVDGEFVELFEGFVSFDVSYSGLYRRKGHGYGDNMEFAFWGVRARKGKDGKEIGLRPTIPVTVSGDQPDAAAE